MAPRFSAAIASALTCAAVGFALGNSNSPDREDANSAQSAARSGAYHQAYSSANALSRVRGRQAGWHRAKAAAENGGAKEGRARARKILRRRVEAAARPATAVDRPRDQGGDPAPNLNCRPGDEPTLDGG